MKALRAFFSLASARTLQEGPFWIERSRCPAVLGLTDLGAVRLGEISNKFRADKWFDAR